MFSGDRGGGAGGLQGFLGLGLVSAPAEEPVQEFWGAGSGPVEGGNKP